jgi:thermosome
MSQGYYPMGGQPIIILKEGTSREKGKGAMRKNIMAAKAVAEIVKSSLGPRGMDKMLVDPLGDIVVTNDGATMLKEMEIEHPAAKMMVEAAKTQDMEAGDGTTSVVVLAGALLEKAEKLIDRNIHPVLIIDGFKKAADYALSVLNNIAIKIDTEDDETLKKIAMTSLISKYVSSEREYLAELAVKAVRHIAVKEDGGYKIDLDDVKLEKKTGGSIKETILVDGVVLDKEVVHSGMPKKVEGAKILLLNAPLEVEKTEFDARINITSPEQMKMFIEEKSNLLKEMVEKIKEVGANVVICQKGIDDLAQHFMARAGILAVRRVKQSDMVKLSKATGARVVNTLEKITPEDLGSAKVVEERKVEEDRFIFIEGCEAAKSVTILIRGGNERVVNEVERSLTDALSVVRDALIKPAILAGGGAPEAELAKEVRKWAVKLSGREQLAAMAFADALETIPLTLAENAGLDVISIDVKLKSAHNRGKKWHGVDVFKRGLADMMAAEVLEPLLVKEQVIKSATEVASMILRVDDVVAASRAKEKTPSQAGGAGGMPYGMPYGGGLG